MTRLDHAIFSFWRLTTPGTLRVLPIDDRLGFQLWQFREREVNRQARALWSRYRGQTLTRGDRNLHCIRRGLTALAFIGTRSDLKRIEALKAHTDVGVSNDTRPAYSQSCNMPMDDLVLKRNQG